MLRQFDDLLVIVMTAVAALLLTMLNVEQVALRAALAIPLVVVLPGYAISTALFPKRIGLGERLVFSIGLSLITTVLSGLLLHLTAWGLQPVAWSIALTGITVVACALGAIRRRKTLALIVDTPELAISMPQWAALLTSALVIGAVIGVARIPASQEGINGYTLLWLLPSDSDAAQDLQLGITSMEFLPIEYTLQLKANGQVVQEWQDITLQPGDKWEQIAVLPERYRESNVVEAMLYRQDKPDTMYRHVLLKRGNQ
jgi:hypothetical protein